MAETNFGRACSLVGTVLETNDLPLTDAAAVIRIGIDEWSANGQPSGLLVDIVRAALTAETVLPDTFSSDYFRTHESLTIRHLLSFENARGLLSQALFIKHLVTTETMSCAQAANTLSARRGDFRYSWQQLQTVARTLASVPKLSIESARETSDRDAQLEEIRLADATPADAIDLISLVARQLGYPGDIAEHLNAFYDPSADPKFEPAYSIVLHANALTAEFFDHPPQEAAYEFEPRGGVVAWLQRELHPSYEAAESAYLNNSKGAYAFDSNWAWGRRPNKWRMAHSLSDLLHGLGAMPHAGRRELAGWLRQWLLRIERERQGSVVQTTIPDLDGARRFLIEMSKSNTATSGVLDQRALDFVASETYSSAPGWRERGLGHHVNASNTSKRKLGDVEFENANERSIVAYEAHGGRLTEIYVEGHRLSLRSVLHTRRADLIQVAPAAEWTIRVIFVAHEFGISVPADEVIEGFTVEWNFVTYEEFVANQIETLSTTSVSAFHRLVTQRISEPHVPDRVRERFNSLSAAPVTSGSS